MYLRTTTFAFSCRTTTSPLAVLFRISLLSLLSCFPHISAMAQSLAEECTPLKLKYDTCFNAWFEGYLEPAVSASATPEQRTKFSEEKAAEFERSCGKLWREYKGCVQVRLSIARLATPPA